MFSEKLVRALQSRVGVDEAIIEEAAPMGSAIRQMLAQEPFEPFLIRVGKSQHAVFDPRRVEVGDSVVRLFGSEIDETGQRRWQCIIALIHVACLESIPVDQPIIIAKVNNETEGNPT